MKRDEKPSRLRVKNWEKHQHYKNRNPTWIKLHASILNDYELTSCTDRTQLHLIKIWILASKLNGFIPYDGAWVAQQIGSKRSVDLDLMIAAGFLIPCDEDGIETTTSASTLLASCKHSASLETEREKEREKSTVQGVPCTPPTVVGEGGGGGKKKPAAEPKGFTEFWAIYPRKVGKGAARSAWRKRAGVPLETILAAVERQTASEQWTRDGGQYIPHPATWLNQGRWEDELEPAVSPDDDLPEFDTLAPENLEMLFGDDPAFDRAAYGLPPKPSAGDVGHD